MIRLRVRRRHWGNETQLTRRARRVFGAPAPYAALTTIGLRHEPVGGDVRGEWLLPTDPIAGVVLYVHGGGFVSCSPSTHRPIAAALARFTRRRVFSADYRLAPESRLPAAHNDVLAAFEWLVASGVEPSTIALAGDSAGGNLAISVAMRLRDMNRPAPGCVVAFSPWTDLSHRTTSMRNDDDSCAMFYMRNGRDFAAVALGRGAADAPGVSPMYAEARGLPPLLFQVGSTELLLDDSVKLHERVIASGGVSKLEVYDDVPHGWQMLVPFVPEATQALRNAAAFIRDARAAR